MKKILGNNFIIVLSIICCLVFTLTFSGILYAKYAGEHNSDNIQRSENFYFYARNNLLDTTSTLHNVNNGNTFDVEILNYENDLKITPSNTNFTFAVTGGTFIGGTLVDGHYVLTGGQKNSIIFTITATSNTVSIIATATTPYTKSLTGNFNLVASESNYSISALTSNDNYLEMTLHIGSSIPTITLVWDSACFSHDNTNPVFANAEITSLTMASAVLSGLSINTNYTLVFIRLVNGTLPAVSNTIITGNTTITIPALT